MDGFASLECCPVLSALGQHARLVTPPGRRTGARPRQRRGVAAPSEPSSVHSSIHEDKVKPKKEKKGEIKANQVSRQPSATRAGLS